jgi:hypothetical protein
MARRTVAHCARAGQGGPAAVAAVQFSMSMSMSMSFSFSFSMVPASWASLGCVTGQRAAAVAMHPHVMPRLPCAAPWSLHPQRISASTSTAPPHHTTTASTTTTIMGYPSRICWTVYSHLLLLHSRSPAAPARARL